MYRYIMLKPYRTILLATIVKLSGVLFCTNINITEPVDVSRSENIIIAFTRVYTTLVLVLATTLTTAITTQYILSLKSLSPL